MPPFLFQRKSGDGKRKYWYIGENKRVNGKIKRVWEKYIGSTERLIEIFNTGAVIPDEVRIIDFGLLAATLDLAEELNLINIINKHAPKREQGLSVGEFNLLSILNRCDQPVSKNKFKEWYDGTFLPSVLGDDSEKLNTQNFINHMRSIDERRMRSIEEDVCKQLLEKKYITDTDLLFLYDPTNIFTFIDFIEELEDKGKRIPQKGKNKAKRYDLRQINIAMMVTKDFGIPVLHSTYNGNINDVTKFKTVISTIIERTTMFINTCEKITLVFDKGNNCQEGMDNIEIANLNFVGSLRPSTQRDMFDIPLSEFKEITSNEDEDVLIKSYRQIREIFDKEYTLVISYDRRYFKRSLLSFLSKLEERERELDDFVRVRVNKKKWTTVPTVLKKVEKILNVGKPKNLFKIKVKKENGRVVVEHHMDHDVLFDHIKYFGKTIHFTNNNDWTDEEIISAYRSKNEIESQFRHMKDPHLIELSPVRHWKDETIRTHVFHCVFALMLLSILKKKLHINGIDLSLKRIVESLRGIKRIEFKVPKKDVRVRKTVKMDETQKRIYDVLNLSRYEL